MQIIIRITNLIQIKWIKIYLKTTKTDFSVCVCVEITSFLNDQIYNYILCYAGSTLSVLLIMTFSTLIIYLDLWKKYELLILITDKTACSSWHFPLWSFT